MLLVHSLPMQCTAHWARNQTEKEISLNPVLPDYILPQILFEPTLQAKEQIFNKGIPHTNTSLVGFLKIPTFRLSGTEKNCPGSRKGTLFPWIIEISCSVGFSVAFNWSFQNYSFWVRFLTQCALYTLLDRLMNSIWARMSSSCIWQVSMDYYYICSCLLPFLSVQKVVLV